MLPRAAFWSRSRLVCLGLSAAALATLCSWQGGGAQAETLVPEIELSAAHQPAKAAQPAATKRASSAPAKPEALAQKVSKTARHHSLSSTAAKPSDDSASNVVIPDLKGMRLSKAAKLLKGLDVRVEALDLDDDQRVLERGEYSYYRVRKQLVSPGESVVRGGKVQLLARSNPVPQGY